MNSWLSIRGFGPGSAGIARQKMHLHGAIITPTDFIKNGTLVAAGDKIVAVLPDRTPADKADFEIETGGLMCPGFVDTHNHAPYAAFRRWSSPARYLRGRFDWRGKTRCKIVVVPEPDDYYTKNVSRPFKEIAKDPRAIPALTFFGQVRGLIGGATTMVIDADIDPNVQMPLPGFVRDPSDWPGRVWGVLDVGCVDGSQLTAMVDDLRNDKAKLLVHVGEGVDEFSRGEFMTLDLKGLLTSNTALIHAMALLDSDWQLVKQRGASVIWSPRSNFRLYGRSIDIGQVLGADIPVALAPDWTITGSSTVLDEIAYVRRRYRWIDDQSLFRMVTDGAADIMGMPLLGRLAPDAMADVLVFPYDGAANRRSAVASIVSSTHGHLRLALVGGVAVYGVEELMTKFPDIGAPIEQLTVPLPDGTFSVRMLRSGRNLTYTSAVNTISELLATQNLTMAPLWEPD